MLAIVSPLRSSSNNDEQIRDHGEIGNFSILDDFNDSTLLEDFNFDDLFVGFEKGDELPDLEVDPAEILAEFSAGGDQEDSGTSTAGNTMIIIDMEPPQDTMEAPERKEKKKEEVNYKGEDIVSQSRLDNNRSSVSPETERSRKLSSNSSLAKGSQSKRKVKVDWTPDLHRRFVQAVEQLGVEKAVPSRILELMGIDCLTRHNIASHLQKYRSHRKHLVAREAEAASWSQRRQIYCGKREMNRWVAPTIGFPPAPTMVQPFRPFHVWGHPTSVDPPVHMWPPPTPSYWHHHYVRGGREGWIPPHGVSQGTPYFPQPLPTARYSVPHGSMYRPVPPPLAKQTNSLLQLDALPSKESIDAAIGDVLDKPWLPLPLGLKSPSIDCVLGELQKQGVSKVPPLTT